MVIGDAVVIARHLAVLENSDPERPLSIVARVGGDGTLRLPGFGLHLRLTEAEARQLRADLDRTLLAKAGAL